MKTKSGFILRALGDNYIIVPVGPEAQRFNGIIKINQTGKTLWQLLEQSADKAQMVKALTEQFEIDEQTAKADVDAFVTKAYKANLIEATADEISEE